MKTNAIVRIVLFSLAIVILLGILLTGLGIGMYIFDSDHKSVTTTHTPLPVASDGSTSSGAVGADQVRSIEIDWAAGNLTIRPDENASNIKIEEFNATDSKYLMFYQLNGDTLEIDYCEDSVTFPSFGITLNGNISKDLVITVPADWTCETLEIDAASANVSVSNMTIREVEFDGASGICTFDHCSVGSLDMDTASGDIEFTGSVDTVDFDGASANLKLYLTETPNFIDVDTASGDLDVTLPADCGFTVSMDTMSSDFYSEFPTTKQGKTYVCGDGSCRINISAMSGKVIIREGI